MGISVWRKEKGNITENNKANVLEVITLQRKNRDPGHAHRQSVLSKALRMCAHLPVSCGTGAMTRSHFPKIVMFSFLTATAKRRLYTKFSKYDDSG